MNMYAYVGNNPVRYVDPFGLYRDDGAFWQCVADGLDWVYDGLHIGMDVAGSIPAFGEPVDFIHGCALASESKFSYTGDRKGKVLDSGLTFAGMNPFGGDQAKYAKYVIASGLLLKAGKEVVGSYIIKFSDGMQYIGKGPVSRAITSAKNKA